MKRAGGDDERGVTLVLFALLLTALLAISAIVVDLGQAYANRRQGQNGADAAAVAGTRWVAKYRWDVAPSVSDLVSTVSAVVADNRGDTGADLHCWIVNNAATPQALPLGNPIDVCQTPSASWANFWSATDSTQQAQGVRVTVTKKQDTILASAGMNIRSTTIRTSATATMQPVTSLGTPAPFILCSQPDALGIHFILDPDDPSKILQSAIDAQLLIPFQSNKEEDTPSCVKDKKNTGFDGQLNQSETPTVGLPVDTDSGNGTLAYSGPSVLGQQQNMCTSIEKGVQQNGCYLVLPIADEAYGNGTHVTMIVKAFGVFRLYGDGNMNTSPCDEAGALPGFTKYCGKLVSQFTELSGGSSGTGGVAQGGTYVVRLVE